MNWRNLLYSSFSTLLLSLTCAHGQFDTNMQIEYSKMVGDSFEIYISLPPAYNHNDKYNVVYYVDANLKSGRQLRELISKNQYDNLQNSIFIGIGHIGNYRTRRARDFILPDIRGKDTIGLKKNRGQIENFYAYLKEELVPSVNVKYKTNVDSNRLIGHSLGGLFAFYCLFKAENLFSKYFALGPSLWVRKSSVYKFNKIQSGLVNPVYIYFSAGSKEKINRILKGTKEIKHFLDKKRYDQLNYEYDIWKGKAHHSAVPFALKKILREKL